MSEPRKKILSFALEPAFLIFFNMVKTDVTSSAFHSSIRCKNWASKAKRFIASVFLCYLLLLKFWRSTVPFSLTNWYVLPSSSCSAPKRVCTEMWYQWFFLFHSNIAAKLGRKIIYGCDWQHLPHIFANNLMLLH